MIIQSCRHVYSLHPLAWKVKTFQWIFFIIQLYLTPLEHYPILASFPMLWGINQAWLIQLACRNGLVAAADGREIETEWVIRCFNNLECPNLKGKPKFFVLQVGKVLVVHITALYAYKVLSQPSEPFWLFACENCGLLKQSWAHLFLKVIFLFLNSLYF